MDKFMKVGIIGGTGMPGNHTENAVVAKGYKLVLIHGKASYLPKLTGMNWQNRIVGILLFFMLAAAPSNAQTLRGTVRDGDNGSFLKGAEVQLSSLMEQNTPLETVVTDSLGAFRFANLKAGYYHCKIVLSGYESHVRTEVLVAAGKETTLDIALRRATLALPELIITANNDVGRRRSQPLSEISLTREQTLRYPATFFDPARLAMAAPGVAGSDDQANGLSVRGHTPGAIRWRLEGVDIVNPNHLSNAGTFSDLPASASGGVLMFSAQLIDRSALLTGAFPAGYGDATGGIMDIYLRRGNAERAEYTVQAGLIGVDLAAEGPFSSAKKASYLVNYRYSAVGLLGKMGVSFGNESITFQDLSLNLHFPTKKAGEFTLFGMGGLSSNNFVHTEDREAIKTYKELLDIDYYGKTGLAGISHLMSLGKNAWIKSVLIGSVQRNERTTRAAFSDIAENSAESGTDTKIAGNITAHKRVNIQNRLRGGISWSNRQFNGHAHRLATTYYQDTPEYLHFWQPWAEWEWSSARQKTILKGGLHTHWAAFNGAFSAEPRLTVAHRTGKRSRIAGSWGLYSEAQPIWLYLGTDSASGGKAYNRNLDFTRSQQATLRFDYTLNDHIRLYSEVFAQKLWDIPVYADRLNAFSLANQVEGFIAQDALTNKGRGRHYGLEMAAEHLFDNGYFWSANVTLLKVDYTGSDGVWRQSRWSARHIANITAGKEWTIAPKGARMRTFGISTRANWREGFLDVPVTPARNPFDASIRVKEAPVYSRRLPDFYRVDLRCYWKRNIADRRNSTFAIDFQNVTNARNVAYYYYEPFTQKEETKLQLGLIPNLSWKLEF